MPKESAGILLYRIKQHCVEVFLVHPGGPFWSKKDAGAWSIPKGEIEEGEDPFSVAIREFGEETGQEVKGNFIPLKPIKQKGHKTVIAWAVEGDADPTKIVSNRFELEWPPKSGRIQEFPEVDRAEWFVLETAIEKINSGQSELLKELMEIIRVSF